jgi:hypothetical protein
MRTVAQTTLIAARAVLLFLLPGILAASDSGTGHAKSVSVLQSAGALEFGPGNVLFVGDNKAGVVHAFVLRAADVTPQLTVNYGNARTFEGKDLIAGIDRKLATLLGTTPDQVAINDMIVHQPSKQIFLSMQRGRGPDAVPLIVKVNDGRLELLDVNKLPHTEISMVDLPGTQRLEFGQLERNLAITDIKYFNGEIFVTGVSNEEFASKLRRIRYPFANAISTSSIEIWHTAHAEFETRAPIIKQLIREIDRVPYLIAVYACSPLVRIPIETLRDGARVRGETIGELGYGNTPVDMVAYTDASDGKTYVVVANNSRSAVRFALSDVATTAPLPENAPTNLGPAGISQFPLPVTAAEHLALIDEQWAVVIRHPPSDDRRLDVHTLPLPLFFDRADQMVEMNWPGGPDPFHYHSPATNQ